MSGVLVVDLIVLVPLVLAPVAWFAGRRAPGAARVIGLVSPIVQLALLGTLGGALLGGEVITGARRAAALWATAIDGLSAPLVALTAVTGIAAAVASWRIAERVGAHYMLLLIVQAGVSAVFLADNLLMFYIAWETVLVPMFLLIGGWGSSNARRAAMKFLLYTFAGGLVLLAGVVYVLVVSNMATISQLSAIATAIPNPSLAFWLLAIGFLIKLPVVPFHTWLPDAHTEAPTAGSILLAGVLLKMGGYGLIRVAMPVAPLGWEEARWVLAVLGIVGIVWGAATALVQTDLKRLIAYSSVAHMGFVVLAVSIGTPLALAAALVTMVSHGLVAGLLFFLVGSLYDRAHTRELSAFGGLGLTMPKWSSAFVFACLASAGLPALSGFPGEFVTLIEGFNAWGWWMGAALVGVALAAAYNLRAVRSTVHGPLGQWSQPSDLDVHEIAVAGLLAGLIVALGVVPDVISAGAGVAIGAIFGGGGAL